MPFGNPSFVYRHRLQAIAETQPRLQAIRAGRVDTAIPREDECDRVADSNERIGERGRDFREAARLGEGMCLGGHHQHRKTRRWRSRLDLDRFRLPGAGSRGFR